MSDDERRHLATRYRQDQLTIQHSRAVARAVSQSVDRTISVVAAGGDARALRGIPVVARGVPGVSPGTQPNA